MNYSLLQKTLVTGAFFAFTFLIGCATHVQNPSAQNDRVNSYQIPGPGINAVFNTPPQVFQEQTAGYFDIAYTFSSTEHINDTATYFQSVGFYANTQSTPADKDVLMKEGLNELNRVMSPASGLQLLLKEQASFKGCPAWQLKYFSPANVQMGFEAFYISIIAFVRDGYFIQLVVFNKTANGQIWEGDSFFENIEFTESVAPHNLINKGNCSDYFQFKIDLFPFPNMLFPGAVRHHKQTVGTYHVEQYQSIPQGYPENPVLLVGVDVYTAPGEFVSSTVLEDVKKKFPEGVGISELSRQTTVLGSESAEFISLFVDYPETAVGAVDFIDYNLFFKHKKQVIHAYTYISPEYKNSQEIKDCFLEWVGKWGGQ